MPDALPEALERLGIHAGMYADPGGLHARLAELLGYLPSMAQIATTIETTQAQWMTIYEAGYRISTYTRGGREYSQLRTVRGTFFGPQATPVYDSRGNQTGTDIAPIREYLAGLGVRI